MEQPLVSVVVISYNQGKFINENLDSLKSQTYTNWELIVADDFSTDNSVEVFENWLQENNITAEKIYHKINTGLATVLNEAIDICKGKYVKLIAADDYLHPNYLEKSVSCLEKKGEEYGMVFTDTFCVDENSNPKPDIADYNSWGNVSAEDFRKKLKTGNRIAACTVLLKKEILLQTGLYTPGKLIEDYDRWLRINEIKYIDYIPEKLTFYRLHSKNTSALRMDEISDEDLALKIKYGDKEIMKPIIRASLLHSYKNKRIISRDTLFLYKKSPHHEKLLYYCLRWNVPFFLYIRIRQF